MGTNFHLPALYVSSYILITIISLLIILIHGQKLELAEGSIKTDIVDGTGSWSDDEDSMGLVSSSSEGSGGGFPGEVFLEVETELEKEPEGYDPRNQDNIITTPNSKTETGTSMTGTGPVSGSGVCVKLASISTIILPLTICISYYYVFKKFN